MLLPSPPRVHTVWYPWLLIAFASSPMHRARPSSKITECFPEQSCPIAPRIGDVVRWRVHSWIDSAVDTDLTPHRGLRLRLYWAFSRLLVIAGKGWGNDSEYIAAGVVCKRSSAVTTCQTSLLFRP
ncbi:hypothetical protein K438DRAFT_891270 [Mycena galopus ATCC 62051]|nr:hypothetical protein K438DRAFT_891270 [Mycena galopus ATCC 62051]